MKYHYIFYMLLLLVISFSNCTEEQEVPLPEDRFLKVFQRATDTPVFPIAHAQTADNGYLILARVSPRSTSSSPDETISSFYGGYLLKTNASGEMEWEKFLPQQYVNPVGKILINGSDANFICMDAASLGTYILSVDLLSGDLTTNQYFSDYQYPLATTLTTDGGIVLQHYNRTNRSTRIVKMNANGQEVWSEDMSVEEDVEDALFSQLVGNTDILPFFVEEANGMYLVNGFYNFSFSLMFVNAADGVRKGSVIGNRLSSGIRSAIEVSGDEFAIAVFDPLETNISPSINIATVQDNSIASLETSRLPEISNSQVAICKTTLQGKDVICYAVTTNSQQVKLLIFDPESQTLLGEQYYGEGYDFNVQDIATTEDGGISILASTYAMGRFNSPVLIKMSKEDLEELTSQ
ncbi:hypothetical protein V6R21_21435 [Limibacter armeniacum]|uniref:hypothetical protein n=1 Tax=Limibacter armeniacum TaxID=466084 RepID=UPI002FE62E7B